MKVWDAATGKEMPASAGQPGPVDIPAFSPDGKRIASADGTVRVWEATGVQAPRP